MNTSLAKPVSRRSSARRAQWQQHLNAHAASGLTQAAYCREHGLNEKYLSLWKSKLRAPTEVPIRATTDVPPSFIPVIVKPVRAEVAAASSARAAHPFCSLAEVGSLIIKATLRNGVTVELQAHAANALLPLLTQLAQLPC